MFFLFLKYTREKKLDNTRVNVRTDKNGLGCRVVALHAYSVILRE